jgi:hypothetical protein
MYLHWPRQTGIRPTHFAAFCPVRVENGEFNWSDSLCLERADYTDAPGAECAKIVWRSVLCEPTAHVERWQQLLAPANYTVAGRSKQNLTVATALLDSFRVAPAGPKSLVDRPA